MRFVPLNAGSRALHSAPAKAGSSYESYVHADHMYNLQAMKYRKFKIGLGVFGSLAVGTLVPVYAVVYANKKTGSAQVLPGTS